MTVNEAVKWALGRACRECRKAEQATHDGCKQAQEAADLLRALAEQVAASTGA